MGFFGSLTKLALDIVETPVAIVKDVATMGGALTDQKIPYTEQKFREMGKDYDRVKKALTED